MPPSFINIDRRLVMRYSSTPAFSLNHIMLTASNQGVFDLATAIASIQNEQPQRISMVLTRQLI